MKIWPWKRTWIAPKAKEKAKSLHFNDVRSIAVLKHAALGDMVLTRPFLLTLRKYFPNAEITLSVAENYQAGIPHELIDRLHVTYINRKIGGLFARIKNYRELGKHDLLFDISAVSRTFWITYLNKAQLKIGFQHRKLHRFIYDIAVTRTGFKFEAENFLDQLLVLGLDYDWPLKFDMNIGTSTMTQPYIVYFPTASDSYKSWLPEHFAALIKQMVEEQPAYQHILLGGVADWEDQVCQKILQQTGQHENLQYVRGSDETPVLINSANAVVSNDTGIRNLAIATDTPTVGIFISTLPFNYRPRFGQHKIVYAIEGGQPEVVAVKSALKEILEKK
ncbi:MAG: glycosyltransferase family 9 protein [Gammaproteobacteria bacterium]|nr:glycosyltransferase family 9 protein [Gammaproteobacteria bacterium]